MKVRIVSLLIAAGLLPAAPGCGDLSRDELNRGVESLGALAAQGELIANGVARALGIIAAGTIGTAVDEVASTIRLRKVAEELGLGEGDDPERWIVRHLPWN